MMPSSYRRSRPLEPASVIPRPDPGSPSSPVQARGDLSRREPSTMSMTARRQAYHNLQLRFESQSCEQLLPDSRATRFASQLLTLPLRLIVKQSLQHQRSNI
jgi:hypothetical protein